MRILRVVRVYRLIAACFVLLVFLASCGGGSSSAAGDTSLVSITVGAGGKTALLKVEENTFGARARLFLHSKADLVFGKIGPHSAAASGMPSGVAQIVFNISGPDMDTITKADNVSGSNSITETFSVPNGAGRTFAVSARNNDGLILYTGSATADLSGASINLGIDLYPYTQLPSGLVAWWSGDGNANDSIGGNNGALMNGASFTAGEVGQAFSFDGLNAGFQAAANGLPTGSADRTIALWVKIGLQAASESFFAGYGVEGGAQLYEVGALSNNALFFSNWGSSITAAGPVLQNNRWYHVAAANVGSMVTLYLDGVAVASGSFSLATPAGSAFFAGYLDPSRKLNGSVDEIQVYNRALSASEIAAIFNAGSGR